MFEPIAIIGHACVFPGALTPQQLWQNSIDNNDLLSAANTLSWRVNPQNLLCDAKEPVVDKIWTSRGGYISGFEEVFDPNHFAVSSEQILQLDPLFHWLLYAAHQAVLNAQYTREDISTLSTGLIIGNLSYPSAALCQYAEKLWLEQTQDDYLQQLSSKNIAPINRFMSGYPAHFVAKALGLSGVAFALDAACASSLYAIKLACDQLHCGKANMMIAGAVNGAEAFFVHGGFTGLNALSKTGRSLPFHQQADGLVPSHGAGCVLLKRLADAVKDNNKIHAVIRSIGLSNDGNQGGLLAPASTGQIAAMQQAYQQAEIDPQTVSLIDCHATGTPVGDGIEISSLQAIFQGQNVPTLAALKSNIGHALTASGIAALNRLIECIRHRQLPPTRSADQPIEVLQQSPFHLLSQASAWEVMNAPLRAAVNGFGMGGDNAHLVIEEYDRAVVQPVKPSVQAKSRIAIVSIAAMAPDCITTDDLMKKLFLKQSVINDDCARLDKIDLPLVGLRFPPNDLKRTQGEHLAFLQVGLHALSATNFDPQRTAIIVGMQCNPDIARFSLRWRLASLLAEHGLEAAGNWLEEALASIIEPIEPAHVLGAMPNVMASRLNIQCDCQGPSFSISSEELSGVRALLVASEQLQLGQIDTAVVGAADLSCERVHQAAAQSCLTDDKTNPGDVALALVIKREEDARRDKDTIYALVTEEDVTTLSGSPLCCHEASYNKLFGHAHVASGLLSVATSALSVYQGIQPALRSQAPIPWVSVDQPRCAKVTINALGDQSDQVTLVAAAPQSGQPFFYQDIPNIVYYSGQTRGQLLSAMERSSAGNVGGHRLAIVASSPQEHKALLAKAIKMLRKCQAIPQQIAPGVYYSEKTLEGDIAFVFSSSNTSYTGMGRDLCLAFPQQCHAIAKRYPALQKLFSDLYGERYLYNNSYEDMRANIVLSCLHVLLLRELFDITPQVVMGHSVGEFTLFPAMEIWQDLVSMDDFIVDSGLFTHLLSGEYKALQEFYQLSSGAQLEWSHWRILADVHKVKELVEQQSRCYLSIINTQQDCIIAGEKNACLAVIKQFPASRAAELRTSFVIHCEAATPTRQVWQQLCQRQLNPKHDFQVYSCATGQPYQIENGVIGDAMAHMAMSQVNFPRLIDNTYNNGSRVYIECGPMNLCTQWIKKILGDRDHCAIAMDIKKMSGFVSLAHAIAQLAITTDLHYADRWNQLCDDRFNIADN